MTENEAALGRAKLSQKERDSFRRIAEFLREAQERVVVVAACLRSQQAEGILPSVKPGVKINVYSRWRLSDHDAGNSDVGALEVALRQGAEFKIYHKLNTTFYLADDKVLAAPETAEGVDKINPETLREIPADSPKVLQALNILETHSVSPMEFTRVPVDCLGDVRDILQKYGVLPRDAARETPAETER